MATLRDDEIQTLTSAAGRLKPTLTPTLTTPTDDRLDGRRRRLDRRRRRHDADADDTDAS